MSFGEHHVARGDVLDVLRKLPDSTFDALFCDPPYGFRFMGKRWDYDVPSVDVWREALRVLKPGAPLLSFGGSRTYHRLAVGIEDAGFEIRDSLMWLYGKGFPKSQNVGLKTPSWAGYGTALKPAWEPIILARKPLEGTMVANVTAYGCGPLAIDACRIGTEGGTAKGERRTTTTSNTFGGSLNGHFDVFELDAGRWPANLVLDEGAAELLDAQSGVEASRFFYCSKVSTKERETGCEGLAKKGPSETHGRAEGSPGLDNPRSGAAGQTGGARNHHPTLKPLALTRWLATLIKPPRNDAALLVPFSGAGSEMIGALQAGWGSVFGIEGEAEYVAIAEARIAAWAGRSVAA